MYLPFTDALNHALEDLSSIRVSGLPEFKSHIAFVPYDKNVSSNRDSPGSLFKPDVAIMSLEDARELFRLDKLDTPRVSQFVSEIEGGQCGILGWKTLLSVVELKRKQGSSSSTLQGTDSQGRPVSDVQDTDQRLDDEQDASQPTTRKVDVILYELPLTRAGQRFRRRLWYPR